MWPAANRSMDSGHYCDTCWQRYASRGPPAAALAPPQQVVGYPPQQQGLDSPAPLPAPIPDATKVFTYNGVPLSSLECAVCLDPCWDPYKIVPCDHMFCLRCLSLLVHPKRCPTCRGLVQGYAAISCRIVRGLFDSLRVVCSTCRWAGTRDRIEIHNCEEEHRRQALEEMRKVEAEKEKKLAEAAAKKKTEAEKQKQKADAKAEAKGDSTVVVVPDQKAAAKKTTTDKAAADKAAADKAVADKAVADKKAAAEKAEKEKKLAKVRQRKKLQTRRPRRRPRPPLTRPPLIRPPKTRPPLTRPLPTKQSISNHSTPR